MGFIGTYADLDGQRIGFFPRRGTCWPRCFWCSRWKLVWMLFVPQTLPHAKLAPLVQGRHSQISLFCANPACFRSHRESQSETIDEFGGESVEKLRETARVAADAQRSAEAGTVNQRWKMPGSRRSKLRRVPAFILPPDQYNHRGSKITPLARWCELSDGTRKTVLDLLRADPTARIKGCRRVKVRQEMLMTGKNSPSQREGKHRRLAKI